MSTATSFTVGNGLVLWHCRSPRPAEGSIQHGIIAQLRFTDSCAGSAVPSGRGRRTAFPVPRRPRTASAGRARQADQACDQSTTCLQSQIGWGRHLARRRTAQVMAAVGLSEGVDLQPLASVVNGTAGEDDGGGASRRRHQVDRRVRPVPETPDLLARAAGPRQPSGGIRTRRRTPQRRRSSL
jgi:hypothetical protein